MSASPRRRAVVDVWTIELARVAACELRLSGLLDAGEQARAARFAKPSDRLRHRVAHGALRTILAGCTGAAPAELRFAHGAHGKPRLDGGPRFSLSHSGGVVLVAVCSEREVGVDVERVRPVPAAPELARRYLTAPAAQRIADARGAQRDRLFANAWTAVEAILKEEGTGLAGLDRSFDLRDLDGCVLATIAGVDDAPAWTICRLALPAGHAGAVAVRDADVELRMHGFP